MARRRTFLVATLSIVLTGASAAIALPATSQATSLSDGIAVHVGASIVKPTASSITKPAAKASKKKVDTTFTFAMIPDTQQEVLRANDTRFINRTRWLVKQKSALDLRFVGHTGDVVNWDTSDHSQMKVASAALKPLEAAHIPYTLSIGNHDTQATKSPGGARDPRRTRALQRDTTVFNDYFNAGRYTSVAGAYERGKVDNLYTTYNAGGVKWMVLVLELWPRRGVVSWAKKVVASHKHYNVIITTHSYLNGGTRIYTKSGYGDTSPKYLYKNLVSKYANIKFVFCGHAGIAAHRVDHGVHGNKIFTFEQTFHSNTTNPVRLITVNTKTGTVKSRIYAPFTHHTYTKYTTSQKYLKVVR
jgi:Calcineurin-like phosphoesterase